MALGSLDGDLTGATERSRAALVVTPPGGAPAPAYVAVVTPMASTAQRLQLHAAGQARVELLGLQDEGRGLVDRVHSVSMVQVGALLYVGALFERRAEQTVEVWTLEHDGEGWQPTQHHLGDSVLLEGVAGGVESVGRLYGTQLVRDGVNLRVLVATGFPDAPAAGGVLRVLGLGANAQVEKRFSVGLVPGLQPAPGGLAATMQGRNEYIVACTLTLAGGTAPALLRFEAPNHANEDAVSAQVQLPALPAGANYTAHPGPTLFPAYGEIGFESQAVLSWSTNRGLAWLGGGGAPNAHLFSEPVYLTDWRGTPNGEDPSLTIPWRALGHLGAVWQGRALADGSLPRGLQLPLVSDLAPGVLPGAHAELPPGFEQAPLAVAQNEVRTQTWWIQVVQNQVQAVPVVCD